MYGGGLPGLLAGLGTFFFGRFHLFGLPSHGVSVAFRGDGLFCTFVRGCCGGPAHVLVRRELLPPMPVGECGVK